MLCEFVPFLSLAASPTANFLLSLEAHVGLLRISSTSANTRPLFVHLLWFLVAAAQEAAAAAATAMFNSSLFVLLRGDPFFTPPSSSSSFPPCCHVDWKPFRIIGLHDSGDEVDVFTRLSQLCWKQPIGGGSQVALLFNNSNCSAFMRRLQKESRPRDE